MSYLVVVAHPDDEILGAGATIKKLTEKGEKVFVCIMSSKAAARNFKPSDNELQSNCDSVLNMAGVERVIKGDFPNIKMNTVPHLELVQFIEKCIKETEADVIITHHPSDLNDDHIQTSLACRAAVRLFQRNPQTVPVKAFLYMEVPSATDWSLDPSDMFRPNVFVETGERLIDEKIKMLSIYKDVMRDYPHPRSKETIKGLAAYRGSQSGCLYAEAFELAFGRFEV